MIKKFLVRLAPKTPRYYNTVMTILIMAVFLSVSVFAADTDGTHAGENMWDTANRVIVDVYNNVAGISTVLAGLMSAVAVIGAKISNNQHKVDQSWDWLRRIWISWTVINGIGAFLAYIRPLFDGLATLT